MNLLDGCKAAQKRFLIALDRFDHLFKFAKPIKSQILGTFLVFLLSKTPTEHFISQNQVQ